MSEWLILLLIVPAIVVPVVLLAGFAGCDVVFGLDRVETPDVEFEIAFEQGLIPGPGVGDEPGWEGYTLVQRIEPARLFRSGSQIKLTLRATTADSASIDRIYVSQPDPDPASDPFDSGADLTEVFDRGTDLLPLVIPAGEGLHLDAVNYNLDHERPLLIAVDFSATPASVISFRGPVPPQEGLGYWRLGAEAASRDRTADYTPENRLYLIEKIEVA